MLQLALYSTNTCLHYSSPNDSISHAAVTILMNHFIYNLEMISKFKA